MSAYASLPGLGSRNSSSYEVVIAGGGIMGCASAYFLAKRMPPQRILVVERDPMVVVHIYS